MLFQSGNPQPPIAFAGYPSFSNWLHPKNPIGTKEYRAALYLEGVAAEFPSTGAPPRADRVSNGSFVGYTPMRLFFNGVNIASSIPQFAQYKKGTGPIYPVTQNVDPAGKWVELRYRADFKLSWLPNLASRVLVKAWAPYAWCEIKYRFYDDGRISVEVEGSAIPSQWLYIDWTKPAADHPNGVAPEFDMTTAAPAQVSGFIQTAGWGCRPAPGATRVTWQGTAAPW